MVPQAVITACTCSGPAPHAPGNWPHLETNPRLTKAVGSKARTVEQIPASQIKPKCSTEYVRGGRVVLGELGLVGPPGLRIASEAGIDLGVSV